MWRICVVQVAAKEVTIKKQAGEERAHRVAGLAEQAGRRFRLAELVRGWSTWLTTYREYTDELNRVKMLRQVKQRFTKPELADPFLLWKAEWEQLCRKHGKTYRKTAEEELDDESTMRRQAQAEVCTLTTKLAEAELSFVQARIYF